MPRRRTTRAAASKRPIPTLPEDDNSTNMDEEQRKHKVQTLIKDFNTEVNSRIRDMECSIRTLLNQIDLAYSLEIMQIPPAIRSMKLKDYLKSEGEFENPPVSDQLKLQAMSLIGEKATSSKDENSSLLTTVKKKGSRRKGQEGETVAKNGIQETCRQSTRLRKMVYETPANRPFSALPSATPLITPKFDPRLYQTPAVVMRAPKPGEVIVSMDGSPITNLGSNAQSAGLIIPVDDSRSIWFSDSTDLKCVDRQTAEKAYQALDEMKSRLEAALKLSQPTQ